MPFASPVRRLALALLALALVATGSPPSGELPPRAARAESGRARTTSRATASAPRTRQRPLSRRPARLVYPKARRSQVSEVRFGRRVADPYRWLEDPGAAETRSWVEAQNRLSRSALDALPGRQALADRFNQLIDPAAERGDRYRVADRFYFTRRENFKTAWFVNGKKGGRPRKVLDETELPTGYEISTAQFSPDARYLAYSVRAFGSDWAEWRVRDVATGRDTIDHLQSTKFYGVSWAQDGSGFFYSRFPEARPGRALVERNKSHRIYFHRIGTPQYDDPIVIDRPARSRWRVSPRVVGRGRYLLVTTSKGAAGGGGRAELRDLSDPAARPMRLLDQADGELTLVLAEDGGEGRKPILWYQTTKRAGRGRLVRIDANAPPRQRMRTVVPESGDTLHEVRMVAGRVVATYLKDAGSELRVFDRSGTLERTISLPGIGSVSNVRAGAKPNQLLYQYSSFLTPPTEYRINLKTGRSTVVRPARTLPGFDPSEFAMRRVFVSSKDGTRLPMFLVHKKGIVPDGSNPTYLYGYGGFHSSKLPSFDSGLIPWLEAGGVYALPALRGGGEYGEAWHEAGTRLNKQNVFDDFISSAEWLIASGLTSPEKLAIGGGSNGGLLVGAALTQRPELFGAAIARVGVLDTLRYDKFTVGDGWIPDYGSPDRADEFDALRAYSPLHNVAAGRRYPATLVVTGDHDDRVVPAHSYKFAAALQRAQRGDEPILLQVTRNTGHTSSGSRVDQWAFLFDALGVESPR